MITVAELDERIERCLAILADNPHSQVFAALAEAYRRRGEFARAFATCKSGLKHHPDYAPAHVVMAKLYLHQRMIPEALNSLDRAVEIDGPTRTTDQLEAEIHIAAGDAARAQLVIDRLKIIDPGNPTLPELISQIRGLVRAAEAPRTVAPKIDAPAPRRKDPGEITDWNAWAAAIGQLRHVERVFVFDSVNRETASYQRPKSPVAAPDAVPGMFHDLDVQMRRTDCGGLREIRVECTHGEVWACESEGYLLGVIGSPAISFGAVRRRALETSTRVPHGAAEQPEASKLGEQTPASGIRESQGQ